MESEMISRALSFGENMALKKIWVEDLGEMETCFDAAVEDFDNATEEQIDNDESYQYFCAWCNEHLTQEFCDKALGREN